MARRDEDCAKPVRLLRMARPDASLPPRLPAPSLRMAATRPALRASSSLSVVAAASRSPAPKRSRLLRMAAVVGPPGDGLVLLDVEPRRPLTADRSAAIKQRRRSAALTEQCDAIKQLPGRSRLETLKVERASRRQYLQVLWLLACWVTGTATTALAGAPATTILDSLVFLKNLESRDAVLDDHIADWIDQVHWEGGHPNWATRLGSAIGWLLPRHQKAGAGHLPRLAQSRAAALLRGKLQLDPVGG